METTNQTTNQTTKQTTKQMQTYPVFESDDDDYDLIDFGIASNGGRLSMKR
jgi:hypothetical protein